MAFGLSLRVTGILISGQQAFQSRLSYILVPGVDSREAPSTLTVSASFVFLRRTLTIDCPALIGLLTERYWNRDFNSSITRYFKCQYSDILGVLPQNTIALLLLEDQFFIDLFYKVFMTSAIKMVCFQRQQIRIGLTTVEAAMKSIPRNYLKLAALKSKYEKPEMREENNDIMA